MIRKGKVPERVLRDIRKFAERHDIGRVVLFGSRARGTHAERSDVDIAVMGNGDFDGFYWEMNERAHTLLSFDIVELDNGISDELKAELEREGIVIYEKDG